MTGDGAGGSAMVLTRKQSSLPPLSHRRRIVIVAVDYESTKRVLAALESEGVRYVVFGAAALNLHGLERAEDE
jgi:hypothetical protein